MRVYAEQDMERTMGHTLASEQTKDHSKPVVLFKNDGFNIKQLMSDNRFRLQTMLGEAGLGAGKYAHEVMLAKVPNNQILAKRNIMCT